MKKTAAGFPDDWFNSNLRKQIEDTSKAFSLINLSAVQDIVRATTAFTAFQQEIRKQTEALGLGFQQHFTQQAETIARLQDGLKMPLLFARETQLLGTLMSEALK